MRPLVTLLFALVFGGCSLVLDWEPEGQPCAASQPRCLEGYSCLGDTCVANASVPRGEVCDEDVQCADSLLCRGFQCAEPCEGLFSQFSDCKFDELCAPFITQEGVAEGFCVKSECAVDDDCTLGSIRRSCVPIKVNAGACFSGCEFSFDPAGSYSDSCASDSGAVYCQPIGRDSATQGGQLVCLDAGTTQEGDPCSPFLQDCGEGFVCDLTLSSPVCRRLCDEELMNCSIGVCCRRDYGEATYFTCAPNCE